VYEAMAEVLEQEIPASHAAGGGGSNANANANANGDAGASGGRGGAKPSAFGGSQGVLIWLQYIRFLRRTADAGVARQVRVLAGWWVAHHPLPEPGNLCPSG
jgi:hypothetical protein